LAFHQPEKAKKPQMVNAADQLESISSKTVRNR